MKTELTNYAWTQGVILAACYVTYMQFIMHGKSFSYSTSTHTVTIKAKGTCILHLKIDNLTSLRSLIKEICYIFVHLISEEL